MGNLLSGTDSHLIDEPIDEVEAKLEQGNINDALKIIHDHVSYIFGNPLYMDKILSSPKLDKLCIRIGCENLARLKASFVAPKLVAKKLSTVVYIVSRIQKSGGHSRILSDFIRAQPEKNHLILITGVGGSSPKFYLKNVFGRSKNVEIMYSPNKNLQSRLTWLQSILLGFKPEHVFLFNNHADSVAVSALVPEMGVNGSFYHHGDHHLCLGLHLNHIKHIDPHPMGFHRCRDEFGINNIYLPFSVDDEGFRELDAGANIGFTTATAARFNKIEVPYHVSYLKVIPQVLKITGGKHVHIGKLTPWALYSIRREIKRLGIPQGKFIYIDHVSSVWKALQEYGVNLYIASFPHGAGLTLIEAMGAGIPVILHEHQYSRVLSGLELAYPNAFSWDSPEKLYRYLEVLTIDGLKLEGNIARNWYENNYRSEILKEFFRKTALERLKVPSLNDKFRPHIKKIKSPKLYKHRLTRIAIFVYSALYKRLSQFLI